MFGFTKRKKSDIQSGWTGSSRLWRAFNYGQKSNIRSWPMMTRGRGRGHDTPKNWWHHLWTAPYQRLQYIALECTFHMLQYICYIAFKWICYIALHCDTLPNASIHWIGMHLLHCIAPCDITISFAFLLCRVDFSEMKYLWIECKVIDSLLYSSMYNVCKLMGESLWLAACKLACFAGHCFKPPLSPGHSA